jgi:hypothetical protein
MDCALTAVGAEAFAKMFTDHRGTWLPSLSKLSLGYNRCVHTRLHTRLPPPA